jgi:hypothetical protein
MIRGRPAARPATESAPLRREASALVVGEPKAAPLQLVREDAVLLHQVLDDVLLPAIDPSRERHQQHLQGVEIPSARRVARGLPTLALQSTKRHGRWRAGICPTRHAGRAGSEAGTLWQVPACTISCLRTGRGVAPTGRYSTSVRRKRTMSSIRLGDSTPSASAVNVEIGDPPLPMPVGGPPDPASVR